MPRSPERRERAEDRDGVLSSTLKGSDQLSYSAARIRKTNSSDKPKITHGGTPSCAFFS